MSDQFPLSCKYIANTECTILHPFSIHLSLFSIHFPVPVKLDRWGLRPPPAAALGDLVLLRRGADALSGGSGREPWPSTEKGTFSFLFFKREQCYRYIYNYIYAHSTHTYIYYIILYYSILYYHRLYIYIYQVILLLNSTKDLEGDLIWRSSQVCIENNWDLLRSQLVSFAPTRLWEM